MQLSIGELKGMPVNVVAPGRSGVLVEEETHADLQREGLNVVYDLHISLQMQWPQVQTPSPHY